MLTSVRWFHHGEKSRSWARVDRKSVMAAQNQDFDRSKMGRHISAPVVNRSVCRRHASRADFS